MPPKRPVKARRWMFRWWAWMLWILLALLLIMGATALWAYLNRYDLMERQVITALAEQGIEAELDIQSVTRTRADIRDIRLSYGQAPFLDVRKLTAEYQWRDALEGRFERLDFNTPHIRVTLDENLQITDGWLPPGFMNGDGGDGTGFPKRGIGMGDATIDLNTPWTQARVLADAQIESPKMFTADVTVAPTTVRWRDITFNGSAALTLNRKESAVILDGNIQGDQLSHPLISGDSVHLAVDGNLDLDSRIYTGQLDFDTQAVASDGFALDKARAVWDGRIGLETRRMDGAWTLSGTQARLPNTARRETVSRSLSLSDVLDVVPVAEHFSPTVQRSIKTYLSGSDIEATGRIESRADGFDILFLQPARLNSQAGQLTLAPRPDAPIYSYDAVNDRLTARLDAVFTKPQNLSLQNITFLAKSANGWRLDGVDGFSARVTTKGSWTAQAQTGDRVRLGPLATTVKYEGQNQNRRLLKIDSAIDYDGPLPGGVVTGLQTAGRMNVTLLPNEQRLDFAPLRDGTVKLSRVETPTDWVLNDVSFTLPQTKDVFRRGRNTTTITAELDQVQFTATHRTDPLAFDLQSSRVNLSGLLKASDATQNWTAAFYDSTYASETLPGPKTTAQFAKGDLDATLISGVSPQLLFKSPSLSAVTQQAIVTDMQVALDGTPSDYVVTHQAGTVFLNADAAAVLGQLPMEGEVTFADGVYRGTAISLVPRTQQPMNIDYEYSAGAGFADINIPSITFAPKGLQPQEFVPALRGKITGVDGEATADIRLTLTPDSPPKSSGKVRLINMNFGTAPGPLQGVNTEIDLASVLPLQTTGQQSLTVRSFDPGIDLLNGEVEYELVPEGVRVISARWPLGDGFFRLDPFLWKYGADENRVTLRLDKVGLNAFLEKVGEGKIKATGELEGVFPIVISGINVTVEGGRLDVPNGGVIQYEAKREAEAAAQSNEYAGMALEALKNFSYDSLFAEINGPLDGAIKVGIDFQGSNKEVLNGQPFAFDVAVEGELFNIMRSFNTNAQIKSEVLRRAVDAKAEAE